MFLFILGFLLYWFGYIGNKDSFNATSLKRNYELLVGLENSKDFERLYDEFYLNNPLLGKPITKEKFVETKLKKSVNNFNAELKLHSITFNNNDAFINRLIVDCIDEECSQTRKRRAYKKWTFANNQWFPNGEVMCIRNNPYTIPPEFERSISLIIQRAKTSDFSSTNEWAKSIEESKNCIDIQYANTDEEIIGAEGLFTFNKDNNIERYSILVSPRYQVKDDLITAFLLVHELSHVINYQQSLSTGEMADCFEDEANAFGNQNEFIALLNDEELQSLNLRANYSKSHELNNMIQVYNEILNFEGENYSEKTLNYVKSSPYYQSQCRNFN
ncbi:hypothetical protein A2768_00145 [Candidatus Roizmanbacteria bacterium RIFCSPHIGHO2_01_FULL_37_16]|nr:MAG: hypothetical protein A2768_00145 [Candidatus Roizmanbacteria bacterium RIFCSPHIGHO2_01_FULL_37_16]